MFIKCISINITPSKCGNLVLTWRVSCIGDIVKPIKYYNPILSEHWRKWNIVESTQELILYNQSGVFLSEKKKESTREVILYGQSDLKGFFSHLEESVVMCWSNSVKFSIRRKKKLVVLSASVRTTIDLCLLGGHHLFPKFVKTLNVAQKQRATVPVRTRHIHHFFSFQSFTFLFFSLIFLLPTFYFSQTVLAPPSSLNKFPRLVKG